MELSALTFQRQFVRFSEQVQRRSGQPFVSFHEGLPWKWERYKQDVHDEALHLLRSSTWRLADVGTGRILQRVLKAIEIKQNNLVDWPNRYGHSGRSHRALLDAKANAPARRAFERWFLDFFRNRLEDGDAFEGFRKLAGNRYDLVAYLFFLKDWTRFMPIATAMFDKAFARLGVGLVTSRQCSWENYSQYNDVLLRVQDSLREVAGVDARLVDAHSFCWILARLDKVPPADHRSLIGPPRVLKQPSAAPPERDTGSGAQEKSEEEFVERDAARRRLGRLAQDIALESERARLREARHATPEASVQAVWNEPARGYDILSCEVDGTPRHIEVKAARRSADRLSFFVTKNELEHSRVLANYYFYLVPDAESKKPTVLAIESQKIAGDWLFPVNYMASLRASSAGGET